MVRVCLLVAALLAMVLPQTSRATGSSLVTATGTDVTFDPSVISSPVLVGVVAAIGAGAGIAIVIWGIKKLWAAMRAK